MWILNRRMGRMLPSLMLTRTLENMMDAIYSRLNLLLNTLIPLRCMGLTSLSGLILSFEQPIT